MATQTKDYETLAVKKSASAGDKGFLKLARKHPTEVNPASLTPLSGISCEIQPFRMKILRGISSQVPADSNKLNEINSLSFFIQHPISLYFSKNWRKSRSKSFIFKDHPEEYSLQMSKQQTAFLSLETAQLRADG